MSYVTKSLVPFPLSDITTPKSGTVVYMDYFWLTKDGRAYKTKRMGTLQCNPHREVIESVYSDVLKDGFEITHIPIAFVMRDSL